MITLSIVSHGQAALVEALLNDLADLDDGTIARVLVTVNVPERPIAFAPSLPVTVLRNDVPRGFGGNHNAAFTHVTTPWFVILNPDIRLRADPFPALLDAFNTPNIALAAPVIVDADGRREDAARTLITPWRLIARRFGRQEPASHPDWLAGMFLMCRSETFGRLGGFDERYFMYCEDFDLSARARLAGGQLKVVTDAQVVHDARRASRRSMRHLAWHIASLQRMWASAAFWSYRRLLQTEAQRRGR